LSLRNAAVALNDLKKGNLILKKKKKKKKKKERKSGGSVLC